MISLPIETERLRIRPVDPGADAEPLFGLWGDAEANRFVARGDPAVEDFLNRFPQAPREPRAYLDFFLPLVGSNMPLPDPLPPDLEAGARAALGERPPHEAEIPLSELAATRFPKLVVSGGHSAVFDAVCDVLERELGAERAVVSGAGHSIPRAPGYTETLARFLESA